MELVDITELLLDITAPGILAGVWKGDLLIYKMEHGFSNIFESEPMSWNMRGRIGSISKTYTCAIILMLTEQGLLNLPDWANKYLPNIPDGITIAQLGNMTSGLYNYTEEKIFDNPSDNIPTQQWSPNELVSISLVHSSVSSPGKFNYSNTNTVLLGLIAEKVTGKCIGELYEDMIINPFELKSTNVFCGDIDPDYCGYMYSIKSPNDDVLYDVTNTNISYAWSCGHIISDINDLGKWIKICAQGGIFSPEIQKFRKESFIPMENFSYGFGLVSVLNDQWCGHNGQLAGYQSIAMYCPARDITIVVMTNLFEEKSGKKPADTIFKRLVEIIEKNNL